MANQSEIQFLVDNHKRTVVRFTTRFDGSGQETNVSKIDVSTLARALNANSLLMSSNTHPRATYRTTVHKIKYNCGMAGGYVHMKWDGQGQNGDPTIAVFGSRTQGELGGPENFSIHNFNVPATQGPTTANSNGDIYISTVGAVANDCYMFVVELHKNPFDFDNGTLSNREYGGFQ